MPLVQIARIRLSNPDAPTSHPSDAAWESLSLRLRLPVVL